MANSKIVVYDQSGGYSTFLDAESVTTSVVGAGGTVLRQRTQISARDITSGSPTEFGDFTNSAIRVNVATGTVLVTQSGAPWVVSMTTLPVTQSGAPWTITFTTVTPRVVTVTTVPVTQSGAPWVVSLTTVPVTQSGAPWVVSMTTIPVTQSGAPWVVSLTTVPVTQSGASSWIVQRGLADTIFLSGNATAPTAGTAVVTGTLGTSGKYEIFVTVGTGTAATSTDVGNMLLNRNATSLTVLANPANGSVTIGPFRITVTSTDSMSITAAAGGTAAVVYTGTLAATRIA